MERILPAASSRKSNCLFRSARNAPAMQQFAQVLLCEVAPSGVPGEFKATVNGELVVASSRQPYFDAGRVLVERGCETSSILILRHAGSDTNSLVANVGVAA